jgi:integrase
MARTVKDTKLDNKTTRLGLKPRREPYWRGISQGAHIGYRRLKGGDRNGTWVSRMYGEDGKYRYHKIGNANDIQDADGIRIFSFDQAQEKAREWFREHAEDEAGTGKAGKFTVKQAMKDYLTWYESHRQSTSKHTLYDLQKRIDIFILPHFADVEVSKLSGEQIEIWLNTIATSPPRMRTRAGQPARYREMSDDPESVRRRRSSANRILTVLKAALNRAAKNKKRKIRNADEWRDVEPFKGVDSPRIRYLKFAEAKRLVNASEPDFRRLVQAALFTGCRYGELGALKVADFNRDNGTVLIGTSKSNKSHHVVLTDEGQTFFKDVTAGRAWGATIFLHGDMPWKPSHQARPMAAACKAAKIRPAISFHILRHTYASQLVMGGVPLMVVARNLGHSDTRMVEKHYGHLSENYIAEQIRDNAPAFSIYEKSNVAAIG